jgi:hypothetical protein
MLSKEIQFATTCQKRQVVAYLKKDKYDVYLSGLLIKINASFEWVMTFKTIMQNDL